jgi:hypothetical protein
VPELIVPTARLHAAWIEARDEWGTGVHQDGSGLERSMCRVMITCAVNNVASAKTIEHHGGVLEDIQDTELGALRRYWIDL